jgi:hypothetical protein
MLGSLLCNPKHDAGELVVEGEETVVVTVVGLDVVGDIVLTVSAAVVVACKVLVG